MDRISPRDQETTTMAGTPRPAGTEGQVFTVLHHLVNEAATRLLAAALEIELRTFLAANGHLKLADGSQAVVRNGYLPTRVLRTSVGGIRVRVPRTRDRGDGGNAAFTSALVPPYHARSRLDARLPQAYLESCLAQDPREFLEILLGAHVRVLPPLFSAAIHEQWARQWHSWQERPLSTSRHLCWWVGLLPRGDSGAGAAPFIGFILGLYEDGRHELVHASHGTGDVDDEWSEVLARLRGRGLRKGPQLTHAPQIPAFVRALLQTFPDTLIAGERWDGLPQ